MGNGTDGVANGIAKAPWWIQLIQTVGPTAAIALFLVYVLANQVEPALDSIKSFMAEHTQQMQTLDEQIKTENETSAKQWDDLKGVTAQEHTDHERALAVQEQTCINSSKSGFQTQKCIDARNAGEVAAAP